MNTPNSISIQAQISDLPRPDGSVDNLTTPTALPRPFPNVADSGRIIFGSGLRLLSK